jgi:hypothetical protein
MSLTEKPNPKRRAKKAAPLIDVKKADAPGSKKAAPKKKAAPPPPPFDWRKPSLSAAFHAMREQFMSRFGKSGTVAFVVHVVLIVAMGLIVTEHERKTDIFLSSTLSEDPPIFPVEPVEPQTTQLEQVMTPEQFTAEPVATPVDVPVPSMAAISTAVEMPAMSTDLGAGNLMADIGSGQAAAAKPAPKAQPKPAKAMFLGSQTAAQRIAFVIDRSGSMRKEGRFDLARAALYQSISTMKPYHRFYVVFYSDRAVPMFDPAVEKDMLEPKPENVQKLGVWMANLEIVSGGKVTDAIDHLIPLKPDLIFLLTDGEMSQFAVDKVSEACIAAKIPVNTIGFKSPQAEKSLVEISLRTKGTYVFVP